MSCIILESRRVNKNDTQSEWKDRERERESGRKRGVYRQVAQCTETD